MNKEELKESITEKITPLEPPKLHELIITECPVCHKGVGLMGKLVREEQLLGHAPQGLVGQMQMIAIALDFHNAIAFPVAMIATDTCDKCGTMFAAHQVIYKMTINQLQDIMGAMGTNTQSPGQSKKGRVAL